MAYYAAAGGNMSQIEAGSLSPDGSMVWTGFEWLALVDPSVKGGRAAEPLPEMEMATSSPIQLPQDMTEDAGQVATQVTLRARHRRTGLAVGLVLLLLLGGSVALGLGYRDHHAGSSPGSTGTPGQGAGNLTDYERQQLELQRQQVQLQQQQYFNQQQQQQEQRLQQQQQDAINAGTGNCYQNDGGAPVCSNN